MKIRLYHYTGFCAILLFSLAGYFSIYGFSYLLSAIRVQAIILAIGLELSKIGIITYLYQWHKKTSKKVKAYLYIALAFLMIFTSGSIYGFLTAGYQKTSDTFSNVSSEIDLKSEEQKTIIDSNQMEKNQLEIYKKRLNTVNDVRNVQEQRLTEVTKTLNWKQINLMKADISRADKEVEELNTKILVSIEKIGSNERSLREIRQSKVGVEKALKGIDVGPLRYLSKVFSSSMDKIANGIFLWLIFIFDPLAVVLMLITQKQIAEKKEQENSITPTTVVNNTVVASSIVPATEKPKRKYTKRKKTVLEEVFFDKKEIK
jgi:hypothetical protein